MSIAAAKLTCYELVNSRNGSYPSLMAAAVNVLNEGRDNQIYDLI